MEVVACYDVIKKKNGNNTAKKLFNGPCNEDGDNFSVVENLISSPLELHFTPVSAVVLYVVRYVFLNCHVQELKN
jgi:hypothetical protein